MASGAIAANSKFPSGTTVGAYMPSQFAPSSTGAPTGAAVATATAGAGGATTFASGLTAATAYIAASQVAGVWQHIAFTTAPLIGGGSGTPAIPGPQGDPGAKGDQGVAGPANLYVQATQPTGAADGAIWAPTNVDGTPQSLATWQSFKAGAWHLVNPGAVDVAAVDAAWRAASAAHLAALDPHADRAYVNTKLASLVANNPGMIAPA